MMRLIWIIFNSTYSKKPLMITKGLNTREGVKRLLLGGRIIHSLSKFLRSLLLKRMRNIKKLLIAKQRLRNATRNCLAIYMPTNTKMEHHLPRMDGILEEKA